jgi:hypothetical protein
MCFGFQVNKTAKNKYSIKFYFNDQSFGANKASKAIPSQSNPPWSPYDSYPRLDNMIYYLKNGYSML